jgi:hypothetical protein
MLRLISQDCGVLRRVWPECNVDTTIQRTNKLGIKTWKKEGSSLLRRPSRHTVAPHDEIACIFKGVTPYPIILIANTDRIYQGNKSGRFPDFIQSKSSKSGTLTALSTETGTIPFPVGSNRYRRERGSPAVRTGPARGARIPRNGWSAGNFRL